MMGFSAAVAVAVAVASGPTVPPDPAVTPAGFWPGGGTAWSGTTTYYGFGREVPYGFGLGSEVYGPRLAGPTNTDRYGPGGYSRPDRSGDYGTRPRVFFFQRLRR
jgi:hypothetical protein